MDNELQARFLVEDDGRRVCTLVVDLTAFTSVRFPDCADGVVRFHAAFVQAFGAEVGWYATETMTDEKRITDKLRTMVPTWFAPGAKPRAAYGLYLHAGDDADDQRPPAFHMYSSPYPNKAKFLRMMLPAERADDPARLLELTREALAQLPFIWATAGYSLYFNTKSQGDRLKTGSKTGPLLLRHPGVDSGNPMETSSRALGSVKTVNWLTILGHDLCAKLGGAAAIGKRVGTAATLHQLPGGVLIQAGGQPRVGDVNRDQPLSEYAAVARAIEPVLATEHPQIQGLSKEQTERWLRRFNA